MAGGGKSLKTAGADSVLAGFLEALGVLGYLQLVYAVLDVAVHEGGQIVHRPIDAVIGDAALRLVVGTELGLAVACRHHGLALRGDAVQILLMLEIVETGAQLLERTLLVLDLRTLLLTLYHETGRNVGQTHG